MKTLFKILKWTGIILLIIVAGLYAFVQLTWNKTYHAEFPEIQASTDSAVIARGKYLVYGPSHCAVCHTPVDQYEAVENGEQLPLIGGWELTIPPGTFRAKNITPDNETGIGSMTDGEIARSLRHQVGKDGRVIPPFMPYANMSDDDLTAVISYLRSQDPVKNVIKPTEYSFIGKMVLALGLIKPTGPDGTPPKSVVADTTIEYGKYLVHSVADCAGCHTKRDLKTGEFIGPMLAGGGTFDEESPTMQGKKFMTPNLTFDKGTGVIAYWTEQQFVDRFKAGRIHAGSPMPWGPFSRMNEVDIRAIYRYLQSVPPVKNEIKQTVFNPGDQFPPQ